MTNNIEYAFEFIIFMGVVVGMIFFFLYLGSEERALKPKTKEPIIVGKCVEFILEGDKRVRGRVCMQRGDEITACWLNRRGEIKYTLLSLHNVLCVTDL